MKVALERSYALPAAADQAWKLLEDLERVASCMPGASITERIDERHFKGTVSVRLGPASLKFRGEVEVLALDPGGRTVQLRGTGADAGGGSAASLDLTARIEPKDAASSTLAGHAEASLSGKAATFGARVADAVAQQVLQQFADNFIAELEARAAAGSGTAGAAAPQAPPPPKQLNALALLWGVVRAWLRSFFGARSR
ncbi:MAG TPA: SRPBCC family protein [Steroidobacteraceae bacterium]|nr:SRPBCC family protein [Steroidobacteraceae bacterium]